MTDGTTELADVSTIPDFAAIIRCTWERGEVQAEALAELKRRGLWLSKDQKRHAGLEDKHNANPS